MTFAFVDKDFVIKFFVLKSNVRDRPIFSELRLHLLLKSSLKLEFSFFQLNSKTFYLRLKITSRAWKILQIRHISFLNNFQKFLSTNIIFRFFWFLDEFQELIFHLILQKLTFSIIYDNSSSLSSYYFVKLSFSSLRLSFSRL